jgi:hypothetical protein
MIMNSSMMKAINSISSMSEMNDVIDMIKIKQKQLRSMEISSAKRSLTVGMSVKLPSSKKLAGKIGELLELRRTKATVAFGGERWTVPISMIQEA